MMKKILIGCLTASVLFAGTTTNKENILEYNKFSLSKTKVNEYVNELYKNSPQSPDKKDEEKIKLDIKNKIVNQILKQQIILQQAYETKLDKTDDFNLVFVEESKNLKEKILHQLYLKQMIDKIERNITEKELKENYEKTDKTKTFEETKENIKNEIIKSKLSKELDDLFEKESKKANVDNN